SSNGCHVCPGELRWIGTAARTACTALLNSAIRLSPADPKIRRARLVIGGTSMLRPPTSSETGLTDADAHVKPRSVKRGRRRSRAISAAKMHAAVPGHWVE